MAETTLLRTSAIVQNASVGTSRPSQVSVGALPLVQVKMTPGGPQIQEGQQRPVQILPPRNAEGAVQVGGLPMVNVKMTQNGPQLDNGRNESVVIRDNKQTLAAGGLPMVQVKMTQGGPQVQNAPNVRSAPPQIQSARPALSQPRMRIGAPQQVQVQQVRAQPQMPELSIDQLMFLRHVADKYLGEQRTGDTAAETAVTDNTKIAEDAIFVIDRMIVMANTQAPEAPIESPIESVADPAPAPAVRPVAVGYVVPAAHTAIARTAPARGYVAPRPGGRPSYAAGSVRMGNGGLAPRGVVRDGRKSGLPVVQVKMDGQRAVVQNQAEVATARQADADAQVLAEAAVIAAAQGQVIDPSVIPPTPSSPSPEAGSQG